MPSEATLLQEEDAAGQKLCTEKILLNTRRLSRLVGNILLLSKVDNQAIKARETSFRLDEQIREAIVFLEPKWSAKSLELDLELPETVFTGHSSLLFTVWTNLIGNAIKYTDTGGTIGVTISEDAKSVQVTVRDTGIGMSEETKAHIFDKFYQGDTSRKSQGNGLGLAICKEIVKKCNGEISVESNLGTGSSFLVKLNK